jgi:protein O-GlcNAc transferase
MKVKGAGAGLGAAGEADVRGSSLIFSIFKRKNSAEAARNDANSDRVAMLLRHGDSARERRDRASAIASYLEALELAPDSLYAFYWLAEIHLETGDLTAAKSFCDRGLSFDPKQLGLLFTLGRIASAAADPTYALHVFERIQQIDPEAEGLDGFLADQYCFLGRTAEGVAAFERVLARNPESVAAQSNLLFVLNYARDVTPAKIFERHRDWGAMHETRLRATWRPFANTLDPDKRLRIGYVSADLRMHAVAFFAEPLLRNHDKETHEICCFDTSPFPEDDVSRRLQSYGNTWRRVGDLNDEALVDTIRASGIDVLIDVSGHSTLNRLLAFARRPAPVQATWLGYLNTTGLSSMDYRITDDYLDPEGTTERFHTERLFRIPNASCFQPAADSPSVEPLPAAQRDTFTFGSVNQWAKVTEDTKRAWAQVLEAVPSTRLVIVARGGQNEVFRKQIVAEFVARGARADQVTVQPTMSLTAFLELFRSLDACLDPFPYGGGTTTMHSLWMGVPVVTLAGRTAFSRNSIGPLSEAGLARLVAVTPARYVEIATSLTKDLAWLQEIRSSLRARMKSSPLVDGVAFARHIEQTYRAMWRNYCCGKKTDLRVTSTR